MLVAHAAPVLESTTSYTPWPADGCTLAEARERVADRRLWREWKDASDQYTCLGPRASFLKGDALSDVHEDKEFRNRLRQRIASLEEGPNSNLRAALRSGALIAHGRPNGLSETPVLIPKGVWPALTVINGDESAAGEYRAGGMAFLAVQVFPVMLAPERVRLLAGYALADAFRKFVLEDPEVSAFAREGINVAPEFEAIFVKGRCFVHGVAEWPVDPDRWKTIGYIHPDPQKRSVFDELSDPDPIEIAIAAEALLQRYRALTTMLRRCVLEAHGVGEKSGQVERVPGSIWAHEDFQINSQGDIFQDNPESKGRFDRLNRRWAAVELRAPGPISAVTPVFHVKPHIRDDSRPPTSAHDVSTSAGKRSKRKRSPKADVVAAALDREGIVDRPAGLTNKEIAAKIAIHVSGQHMSGEALAKAVARHFKRNS
jgi:hypothetical protein